MNQQITEIARETYIDKSKWPRGQWDNEPDKLHFVDNKTGMDCLVVRNHGGAFCGYVAVTKSHPAFEADYDRVQVDVHGGLTYAAFCQDDGKICHVPREGQPHNVYWLGFDCSHSGDKSPGYPEYSSILCGGQYRSLAYVISEILQLAKQLSKREPLREPYDWEL